MARTGGGTRPSGPGGASSRRNPRSQRDRGERTRRHADESTSSSGVDRYVGAPGRKVARFITHIQESPTEQLLWECLELAQQTLLLTLALVYTLMSWAWFLSVHRRAPKSGEGIFHSSDQFDIAHRAAPLRNRTTRIRRMVEKRLARGRSTSHNSILRATKSASSLNTVARKSLRRLESKRTQGLVTFYENLMQNTKQQQSVGGTKAGKRIVVTKRSGLWPSFPPSRPVSNKGSSASRQPLRSHTVSGQNSARRQQIDYR
jgi:hypothetical protein